MYEIDDIKIESCKCGNPQPLLESRKRWDDMPMWFVICYRCGRESKEAPLVWTKAVEFWNKGRLKQSVRESE